MKLPLWSNILSFFRLLFFSILDDSTALLNICSLKRGRKIQSVTFDNVLFYFYMKTIFSSAMWYFARCECLLQFEHHCQLVFEKSVSQNKCVCVCGCHFLRIHSSWKNNQPFHRVHFTFRQWKLALFDIGSHKTLDFNFSGIL